MSTATLVPITVNGDAREVPTGLTLPALLHRLDLDPEQPGIAVARNGAVVRRAEWPATPVETGDEIEIITATQGG
ncbi:MAG: sulfur carrier protein ThiS [Rhodothermales bacterium]